VIKKGDIIHCSSYSYFTDAIMPFVKVEEVVDYIEEEGSYVAVVNFSYLVKCNEITQVSSEEWNSVYEQLRKNEYKQISTWREIVREIKDENISYEVKEYFKKDVLYRIFEIRRYLGVEVNYLIGYGYYMGLEVPPLEYCKKDNYTKTKREKFIMEDGSFKWGKRTWGYEELEEKKDKKELIVGKKYLFRQVGGETENFILVNIFKAEEKPDVEKVMLYYKDMIPKSSFEALPIDRYIFEKDGNYKIFTDINLRYLVELEERHLDF